MNSLTLLVEEEHRVIPRGTWDHEVLITVETHRTDLLIKLTRAEGQAWEWREEVARLTFDTATGEVLAVVVHAEFRRQGLATALWEYALECGYALKHSSWRTNDGDSWARSVGGELPPRNMA